MKIKMKAPKGSEGQEANIEGHTYKIPKSGEIEVISTTHVETLRRHGFEDVIADEDIEKEIDEMEDKDDLVRFIEERGGEADNTMSVKKLKKLARAAANPIEAE